MNKKIITTGALLVATLFPISLFAANRTSSKASMKAPSKLSLALDKSFDNAVSWDAKKIGGGHNGTVKITDAQINLDTKKGIMGGVVTIDMTTIASVDLEKDKGSKEKLETHLKSADFFDVEKNPTAVFTIKNVSSVKGKAGKVMIKGDLLMKGVSHPVVAMATWTKKDGMYTLVSDSFKIDRTKWGVKFGSSLLADIKDRFIEDIIDLKVSLRLIIPKV